jgi:hypothetical protein
MKIYSKSNYFYSFIEILHNGKYYVDDKEIAKILYISYKEYKNFILNNNGILSHNNNLIFNKREECNYCIEKLKEKYNDRLVMIKLIGD